MCSIRSVSSGKKQHLDHAVLSTDGKRRRHCNSKFEAEPDDGLRALYSFCHIKGRNGIVVSDRIRLYIFVHNWSDCTHSNWLRI